MRRALAGGYRPAGLACAAFAVYLAVSGAAAMDVREATELLRRGDYAAAAHRAADVTEGAARADAAVVRAYAARGQGDLRAAEREFDAAVAARPNDWAVRRARAVNLRLLGRLESARREMGRAVALNPKITLPHGFAP